MTLRDAAATAAGWAVFMLAVPALMIALARFFPGGFLPGARPALVIGALCSGCGLFLALWANVALFKQGGGGAAVIGRIKLSSETKRLVTAGPYALCRNPMHLGLVLFYLGLSCAINSLCSLLVPALTLAWAYVFAFCFDEPRLKRDFTEDYARYSAQVPRLFPALRKRKF